MAAQRPGGARRHGCAPGGKAFRENESERRPRKPRLGWLLLAGDSPNLLTRRFDQISPSVSPSPHIAVMHYITNILHFFLLDPKLPMVASLLLRSPRPHPSPSPAGADVIGAAMEAAFVRRTWSIASERHAPRGHLFLVIHGRASFAARDERDIELNAPFMLWLPSSSRGEFRLEAGGDGVAISVLDDFLLRTAGGSGLIAYLRPLLGRVAIATSDRIAPRLNELSTSFSAIVRESHDQQSAASVMMGLHLGIVLVGLWRASGREALGDLRGAGTAQRFRQLVELHYREGLSIDDFARLLGVTRSHLHDACARGAGATPLGLVHERLVEEACRRLEETELSVEQIGYSLGFRDPGYFNRFFKRRRGLAPGAFRGAARARRAADDPASFAAWP
jgi:AraC family transcriptional activator of pobA